jgi:hypothetical protein
MPTRDPDAALVPIFKHIAIKNEAKSLHAGRPIYDDLEVCEIRIPGSKNSGVYPATAVSMWVDNPETGEQTKLTYAERFARQYQQFKMQTVQTKSGTPLAHAPFLTEARRAELRAQNIYTVEQLAGIDGQELKNLGHGGREMKNAAEAYIEESNRAAPNLQMQAELEALRARNALLEEDTERLKSLIPADEFAGMTEEQLREYIIANTGQKPAGSLNRKTLMRMAEDVKKENKERAA